MQAMDGFEPSAADLSAENLLEAAVARADRQRYFDNLNMKEQGDIRIAENYLISLMLGRQRGIPFDKCLPERNRKWLAAQIDKHSVYFCGIPMIDGVTA